VEKNNADDSSKAKTENGQTDQEKNKNKYDSPLYRKGKEDTFLSPDDLNVLIKIIRPKEWLGLACLGLMVLFFFIWLFKGEIVSESEGKGIVLTSEGLQTIYSRNEGLVQSIPLFEGEIVDKDTIAAKIYDKDYLNSYNSQSTKIAEIQLSLDRMKSQENSSKVEALKRELEQQTQIFNDLEANPLLIPIFSEVQGEVVAKYVGPGEYIYAGSEICLVDPPFNKGDDILVYGFFDITSGRKIQPGMTAYISMQKYVDPVYGSIVGKVVYVDPYPGTSERFLNYLAKNEAFQKFIGENYPKYNLRIEIQKDPNDPSGYQWTSKEGPKNFRFTPEFCNIRVHISKKRPIDLIFPK
jgi:HlyD family secretion protein